MSTATTIPPSVIEEIAAPIVLAGMWNWCLYGVLIVQFLYGVLLLETVRTALDSADLYWQFVSGYGDIKRLTSARISSISGPILGSVISLWVQLFFVYRIWILGKKESWWLCIPICLFSAVDTTAAFMGGAYAHVHAQVPHGRTLKVLAMTWLIGNTASDVLIVVAMLHHLTKQRAKDALNKYALVRIVRLTVETNILTTTVSIISLLMVILYPDKPYFVCPTALLGKLYSNTLLVSLNNRISIRDASVACGGLVRSAAGSFPDTSRSEADVVLVTMEVEKFPNSPKTRPLEETESQGQVITDIA